VKNWLGQEIEVGSLVYRGARDGNTSSFKVGRVISIPEGKSPRVEWLIEPGWHKDSRFRKSGWGSKTSYGSPSIDTLVLIDPATFDFNIEEETNWS